MNKLIETLAALNLITATMTGIINTMSIIIAGC